MRNHYNVDTAKEGAELLLLLFKYFGGLYEKKYILMLTYNSIADYVYFM